MRSYTIKKTFSQEGTRSRGVDLEEVLHHIRSYWYGSIRGFSLIGECWNSASALYAWHVA